MYRRTYIALYSYHRWRHRREMVVVVVGDDAVGVHAEDEADEKQAEAESKQYSTPRRVRTAKQKRRSISETVRFMLYYTHIVLALKYIVYIVVQRHTFRTIAFI